MMRAVPRYFLDLPEDPVPRAWDPHAGPRPERADTRYFGAAFTAMEPHLRDPDVEVHLTWDVERLPAYGDRVVAVVLGDESARVPAYAGRVRAVFKCYGVRPVLGAGPLRDRSPTGLAALAQCGVRWLRWLPGGTRDLVRRAGGHRAPVHVIPLGTFNQLDVELVPIAERPTDLFFAGSVDHHASLRHRLASPKTRARREMLDAVGRLRRERAGLRVDLRLTDGFAASEAADPGEYSRALMGARVCLAPRGTSVETFRVFEGLRCGCVVVADRLPRHWFYDGAPILQLDRWRDLPRALAPLGDPGALEDHHRRALDWWRTRCSPEVLGRYLAERIDAPGRPGGAP